VATWDEIEQRLESSRKQGLATALGIRLDDKDAWRDRAACRGMPVEAFFVEVSSKDRNAEPGSVPAEARALRVCARCPVMADCLEDGLRWEAGSVGRRKGHAVVGVFGGSTAGMRKDRRLRGLSIEQRKGALLHWSRSTVLPNLLAPTETLAS
jgi:hypothetical protein